MATPIFGLFLTSNAKIIRFSVKGFLASIPRFSSNCLKTNIHMKTNQKANRSDDELRSENEQIKERLTKVYGMQEYTSCLSPSLENQWLKSIEAFEKTAKKERREELRRGLGLN
jgi:hypothetical protein